MPEEWWDSRRFLRKVIGDHEKPGYEYDVLDLECGHTNWAFPGKSRVRRECVTCYWLYRKMLEGLQAGLTPVEAQRQSFFFVRDRLNIV